MATDPAASDDMPEVQPFAAFLRQMRKGLLHEELSEALQDVIKGVVKHGKQGSLTIKFTIKPESDEAIAISDKWDVKIPTPPAKASLFFADDEGHYSRQRLNQPELPLQGIQGGAGQTQDRGQEAADA